jgi:hypothetical protein
MAYILSAKLDKGGTIDDAINIVAVSDITIVNSNTNRFLLLSTIYLWIQNRRRNYKILLADKQRISILA